MQYVNAFIAVALLGFALLVPHDMGQAPMYIVGATLAAISFKHWLSIWMVRVLALVAAGTMFWYFGRFLLLVPSLQPDWYWQPLAAVDVIGLLFAGFAMIPVLSEYSCRMKASEKCERGRRQFQERKPMFATLRPSHHPRSVL